MSTTPCATLCTLRTLSKAYAETINVVDVLALVVWRVPQIRAAACLTLLLERDKHQAAHVPPPWAWLFARCVCIPAPIVALTAGDTDVIAWAYVQMPDNKRRVFVKLQPPACVNGGPVNIESVRTRTGQRLSELADMQDTATRVIAKPSARTGERRMYLHTSGLHGGPHNILAIIQVGLYGAGVEVPSARTM